MREERRKRTDRRKGKRRKLLTEDEFRTLIETGKASKSDKRTGGKRRKTKRRKRQIGL